MRAVAAAVLAALVCAGAARAQGEDPGVHGSPPPQRDGGQKPLSPEDAELVKQLALLEQLDLVKNLELFEPEKKNGDR